MPPKSKKASAAERARDVQETETPLQAIVLADSFETRFSPFSAEKPRCLLPLVNTPLIEYTLEFLAASGVQEVFVYCGAHTAQIEEYFKDSKWTLSTSPFRLELIRSISKNVGQALRDLEQRSNLSGDFLVLYGDIVSNLPLKSALAEHRARRAKDKNAVMTMVLREVENDHGTQGQDISPVFIIDPTRDRCLHYEQISPRQPNKRVEVDTDLIKSTPELDIRYDLEDCGIDIYTLDVLALWHENFDYEAPRKNFLHNVLKGYELHGKTFHTHIIKDSYASRVRNLNAYDRVSKDIVSRYTYPLCPDSNLTSGHSYRARQRNIYEEKDVNLSWTTNIGRNTVLGKGTTVGKYSMIRNSVIGRNCRIGNNCVIENSYIWDDATIGNKTHIQKSIIANKVVVGHGCTIHKGSLLSYGVKIADGVVVPKRQRITRYKSGGDQIDELSDPNVVGVDGIGHTFVHSDVYSDDSAELKFGPSDQENVVVPPNPENDDSNNNNDTKFAKTETAATGELDAKAETDVKARTDVDADTDAYFYMSSDSAISTESISTLNTELSSDDIKTRHGRSMSLLSDTSDESHSTQFNNFQQDAVSSLYDALREGTDTTTIQLELQSLRLAMNASEHQVRKATVSGIMKYLVEARRSGNTSVKEVLRNNELLFERIMFDKDKDVKDDQVDLLLLIQKDIAGRKGEQGSENMMLQFCNELYMMDILEQEALEQWWEDKRSKVGGEMEGVRKQVERFMQVLAEAESDSEEEEEEEESEEEVGDDEEDEGGADDDNDDDDDE